MTNLKTSELPVDLAEHFCPNAYCPSLGQLGQGNISVHSKKEGRLRCKTCRKTFALTTLTPFYGLKTEWGVVSIILTLLSFGCPTQAIVQAYGLDERTVAAWLDRAGNHSQKVHQALIVQGKLEVGQVQADEIYVKGVGFRAWMAMALMVSTRLWLGGVVSLKRERALADELMKLVVACCHSFALVLVLVDGWKAYPKAIIRAFRTPQQPIKGQRGRPRLVRWPGLMLGQVIKRTLKGRLVGIERRLLKGEAAEVEYHLKASGGGNVLNTSYIERLNATFRQRLAVLCRRTRQAARKLGRVEMGMWLTGCVYNFCQPHLSLRRYNCRSDGGKWAEFTPAMASGITDHVWSISELLWYKVPPPAYVPPKKRGRPPKIKS
jgi:transposase-like protein